MPIEIFNDLGDIALTSNQKNRRFVLHDGVIKGIMEKPLGHFIAISHDTPMTDLEKSNLIASLLALPNTPQGLDKERLDFSNHPFYKKTPDEIEALLDAQVTDLPSAKIALKRIAKALAYLIRRTDLNL